MTLKKLEQILKDNEFIIVQMYELDDDLTNHIDFERHNDLFKTTIGDMTYDLIDLFGNCNVDRIEPISFNNKPCINIILREDIATTYDILSNLGYK